jgi:hypothetical protein
MCNVWNEQTMGLNQIQQPEERHTVHGASTRRQQPLRYVVAALSQSMVWRNEPQCLTPVRVYLSMDSKPALPYRLQALCAGALCHKRHGWECQPKHQIGHAGTTKHSSAHMPHHAQLSRGWQVAVDILFDFARPVGFHCAGQQHLQRHNDSRCCFSRGPATLADTTMHSSATRSISSRRAPRC